MIRLQHIVTLTTKTESAIDYENPWLYQGTAFTSDDIDDFFGFVYRITIYKMVNNISDENTFTKNENQREVNEKSLANPIGRSIMEVQMN